MYTVDVMAFTCVTRTKRITIFSFLLILLTSFLGFGNNAGNDLPYAHAQGKSPTAKVSSAIPSAESVHLTQSLQLPSNVSAFVMLIANEAHESWNNESHKLITDKNAYYIPTNLIIHEGTELAFLNADAPWDTPHPHNIELVNIDGNKSSGEAVVYSTGILAYTNSSEPVTLPVGRYSTVNAEYDTKEGTITVLQNNQNMNSNSIHNLVIGGFYTPTNQVENNKDNDGNPHPGSLEYYRQAFSENGIKILSEFNFTYAKCDYCPGGYWPDNKTGDHTLIVFGLEQPIGQALETLETLVKDNVYV